MTVLAGLLAGCVVIGCLYWAQAVFIPIILAIFLSFPLAPIVTAIQRVHVNRKVAVVVVVLCVAIALGGVVTLVNSQLAGLTDNRVAYTENIKAKVDYVRELRLVVAVKKFGQFVGYFDEDFAEASVTSAEAAHLAGSEVGPAESATPGGFPKDSLHANQGAPPEISVWPPWLPIMLSPVLESFRHLMLALVLVVFILLEREGLSNRLIHLLGNGHMTATTNALIDAGGRISRYLRAQLILNGSYGFIWGLSLYFIGVEYALLWGFLSAILRYIPFVGASLSALLPITLSLAQFPGWWQPLSVIVLLLVLELFWNNVMETWLYGRSIGVSPLAIIISATFWTFLWGPIGLVLSGPLTVCLVVFGRHVPNFQFIGALLGEVPALAKDVVYYRRLLARQKAQAEELVTAEVKGDAPDQVYDGLLMPAIAQLKRDREQGIVTEEDELYILQTTREVLEEMKEPRLAAHLAVASRMPPAPHNDPASRIRILACPARDRLDAIGIAMLGQLLNPTEWDVSMVTADLLTAELVERAVDEAPSCMCIGSLPPGGLAHVRHLCKQVRAQNPQLKIIVGRWGLEASVDADREQLEEAGANMVATSLEEMRKLLNDWRPVMVYEAAR
jgi:predicted PurR-regulated permease PerM